MTDWTGPAEPLDRAKLPLTGESVGNPGAKGVVQVVDASALYKEYLEPLDEPGHLDDLIGWRRSLPPADRAFLDAHCAWPLRRVQDGDRTTGFLMAPAPDDFWADMLGERHTVELQHLVHVAATKRLGLTVPDRAQRRRLVQDLADLLALLDTHSMVYGDISEKNVFWTLTGSPRVYLIDCDNARRADSQHRNSAVARNDGWRDPLLGPDDLPNADSDRFALAVFFYRVFYGVTVSVDQDNGKVLLPEDAPHLPALESLLGAGLSLKLPRPTAAEWGAALREDKTPPPLIPPREPKPPSRHRRTFAVSAAALLLAGAITVPLAVQLANAHDVRPAPTISASDPPSPSPASTPELLTRNEALGQWAAGPVKIKVDHYYSWFYKADKRADDSTSVYVRASITNETDSALDVTEPYNRLVMVMDAAPKYKDDQASSTPLSGLRDDEPLWGAGFSVQCCLYTDGDGVNHEIGWTGKSLAPGETFTSKSVSGNGAGYWLAPIATKTTVSMNVAPGKLHILGIGWLDDSQDMQGFTPVAAWKGANADTGFLGK